LTGSLTLLRDFFHEMTIFDTSPYQESL